MATPSSRPFVDDQKVTSVSVSRIVASNSFVTQWTVAHQDPLSMGFFRQEYWRGYPFPFPGIFLTQVLNLGVLNCRQILYLLNHQGSPAMALLQANIQGFNSVQWLSHVRLCNPMDCSTPGFPVHHQLLEFAQTHVHLVGSDILPSHPLSPSPPAFNLSQHQGLFQWVISSHQVAKILKLQQQSFQRIVRTDFL